MCIETMRPDWDDCIAAEHVEARSDYVGGGIEKRNKFDLISCHEFYLASTVGFCWKLLGVPFRANRLKKKKRFAALLWRTFMVLLSIGGWSLPSKRG